MVAFNQPPGGEPRPGSIAEQAERIYSERLRSVLEPEHVGEFVVVNVATGEYELDASDVEATERAALRFPADSMFLMRVGHRVAYRIGLGGSTAR